VATLARARAAFERREWADAYALFEAADRESALDAHDLDTFATAAALVGRYDESAALHARAHQALLDAGDVENACRCAFWLGLNLLMNGERARGSGWLARARRLIDDGRDCAEQGYLLLPAGLQALAQHDAAAALTAFRAAADIGARFAEPDLLTLGRLGTGQALIRLGRADEGVALLDEAMVAVEADELAPNVAGIVYCAVIETCWEIFDLRRAHEWTDALTRWCDAQPDLVPYRGQCLLRRAELMALHGEWSAAFAEARHACARLTRPAGQPAAAEAFYRLAELHRLSGEIDAAEEAYITASELGRTPQPGLAQLRLAQGRIAAAVAALRRAIAEPLEPATRCVMLAAYADALLAARDVAAARTAADELTSVAASVAAPFGLAHAQRAHAAVLLAEESPRAALDALRNALAIWDELDAPYEAARVRALIGAACRALGDEDGARLELDAARAAFERLGATPDLAALDAADPGRGRAAGRASDAAGRAGLTPREREVLGLVAHGLRNGAIAERLGISPRTVDRHVSSIFMKLAVESRSAATAWAHRNDVV
jgi:DNA-binding CsgD family transcriptional regulator